MLSEIIGKLTALYLICAFYMMIESINHKKMKKAVIWGILFILPIAAVIALIFLAGYK